MALVSNTTKEIPLSQSKVAIVDSDDYEYLSQWKWYYRHDGNGKGYAARSRDKVRMHRIINKTPSGMLTDHINRNKLDNRKCNLRTCTSVQNKMNTGLRKDNTSGYKGVVFEKRRNRWVAQIGINGKNKQLGRYKTAKEAAIAYNSASASIYGEYAYCNPIDAK